MNDSQTARKAYYSAADRAPLEQGAGQTYNQKTTSSTRQALAADLIAKAEHVAAAVKTSRAFDATGHMLDVMPHLDTAVQDLTAAHRALVADVTRFIGKTGERDRLEAKADPRDKRLGRNVGAAEHVAGLLAVSTHALTAAAAADLEASIARHPAGSALADLDAAEAKAAGEPTLQQLGAAFVAANQPTFYPAAPKPAPGTRRLADRPQA